MDVYLGASYCSVFDEMCFACEVFCALFWIKLQNFGPKKWYPLIPLPNNLYKIPSPSRETVTVAGRVFSRQVSAPSSGPRRRAPRHQAPFPPGGGRGGVLPHPGGCRPQPGWGRVGLNHPSEAFGHFSPVPLILRFLAVRLGWGHGGGGVGSLMLLGPWSQWY